MARFWLPYLTILGIPLCGRSQVNHSVLDQFCAFNPSSPGCEGFAGGVASPGAGSKDCSRETRRCPELNVCVPRSVPCTALGAGVMCNIPVGFSFKTQTLLCGDGKAGVLCGNRTSVPLLTQLLVQCVGANTVDTGHVTNLGVVREPGKDGVAGVYHCDITGSWQPLFGSSALSDLIRSCGSSGCGRVPQPRDKMPIHRPWSWVRAIYYNNNLHCTATIVSRTAVLTAAHCVTSSQVSQQALPHGDFTVELPGPTAAHPRRTSAATAIYVHPRYDPQDGRQHDVALVFFKPFDNDFPVACIPARPVNLARFKFQVVFRLQPTINNRFEEEPGWKNGKASRDDSCIPVSTRIGVPCRDRLNVKPSQFCASHPDLNMVRGSSGGPYLVEVGTGVEEVWVVHGILSHFSNESSCNQDHSVYSLVGEDSQWINACVFDRQCS